MVKGDVVLFNPPPHVVKNSDGLKCLVKQYDSPYLVYQVIGCWVYLYRLMDGEYNVSSMTEYWQPCNIDLNTYVDKFSVITHLLSVGVE